MLPTRLILVNAVTAAEIPILDWWGYYEKQKQVRLS